VALPPANSSEPEVEMREVPVATGEVGPGFSTIVDDLGVDAEMVGFTWRSPELVVLQVRGFDGTRWTEWLSLEGATEDSPDSDTAEYVPQGYANPAWLGSDMHSFEVRVLEGTPVDLTAHPIDTEPPSSGGGAFRASTAGAVVAAPAMMSRAQWGADESIRGRNAGCNLVPDYASEVRFAIVHHTVSSNTYTPAESAALVRGIYEFHVRTNGWCDIAYNFLVDRYGQTFEGRYGGVRQPVIGGHAGGFNSGSSGVAVIGEFDTAAVPQATYDALRRVLAFILSNYGIEARGSTWEITGAHPSARPPDGAQIEVPNIEGHRDTNHTACPGQHLYALLPQLRRDVAGDVMGGLAGATWRAETLDGQGGPQGRIDAPVGSDGAVVNFTGRPHAFYYDLQSGNLRHAWWSGTTWGFETLDGAGGSDGRVNADVGQFASAAIIGGRPHVFYYDASGGNLRHAYYTGTAWGFETLDGAGGSAGRINSAVGQFSSVVDYTGKPHVFYLDEASGDLRHAWWSGTAWGFETLDGAGGTNGRINRALGADTSVTLYGGHPHVFYRDSDGGDLRHAYYTGTTWGFETLDGAGGGGGRVDGDVGRQTAVALFGGRPHVWHSDVGTGALRVSWWTGSAWLSAVLDPAAGGGFTPSVTTYLGVPHVWYTNGATGDLRHMWWSATGWAIEVLDGAGGPNGRRDANVGWYAEAVVFSGGPHVLYWDASGADLRHAWYG
jgi:hypothetical protein